MIQVKKIIPEIHEHFDPDGNSLGFLNEYESLDLRVQIADFNTSGYKIKINDVLCDILPSGKFAVESNLVEIYEVTMDLYSKLFMNQRKHHCK